MAIPVDTLMEEAKCYLCLGNISMAQAMQLALLNRIAEGGGSSGGGLVYRALLRQSGNPGDAPTAIELENTLGVVTFTYGAPGGYELKCVGAFSSGKVGILAEPTNWNNASGWQALLVDADTIGINSFNLSVFPVVTQSDGVLFNSYISIVVYP